MNEALPSECECPEFQVSFVERASVWLKNLRCLHIKIAVNVLSRAMQEDKGFRDSWQANIAMPIYDRLSGWDHESKHAFSNRTADVLMKHLFDA